MLLTPEHDAIALSRNLVSSPSCAGMHIGYRREKGPEEIFAQVSVILTD